MSLEHRPVVAPPVPVAVPRSRRGRNLNSPAVLAREPVWSNQAYRHSRHPAVPRARTGGTAPDAAPAEPPDAPATAVNPPPTGGSGAPLVDFVLPVRNQERALAGQVARLHRFLSTSFPHPWQLTIVDAASTDGTWALATRLTSGLPGVIAWRLPVRGRGAALRESWLSSPAGVVVHLDLPLAADVDALPALVDPLLTGDADLCVGNRFAGRRPVPGPWPRALLVRCYNLLLRAVFRLPCHDAGCGVKAGRRDTIRPLLAGVADDARFFDTELVLVAHRAGLRVREVPAGGDPGIRSWSDPQARELVATALAQLRGAARAIRSGSLRRMRSGRAQPPRPVASHREPVPSYLPAGRG